MAQPPIKTLFAGDIYRRIEEVIKVDQTSEAVLRAELDEYVVTDAIRDHYRRLFEEYWHTKNNPHEGTAIWVSGFFGSGKSSFAKMLGLALQNQEIEGSAASERFAERASDQKIQVLLKQITQHVPTNAVIFDVSTDRGIRSGNQTLTEIMYRLFLRNLGYAEDLDLAELEIALEEKGELGNFKDTYQQLFGQEWDDNKDLIAFSLTEASAVMHALFPDRNPTKESWAQAVQNRADINPGKLAERCKELMGRHHAGKNLVFVIDEVGQFVARDIQKMLDLQAIVQSLGRVAPGKMWIVVTSQERLSELVGGVDEQRVELNRLMDRFPLQVHLEPSDISEVTSKRVLAKTAAAEQVLRTLYKECSGRLNQHTKLTAAIKLPELTAEHFMDLYPLLPYQIDLIIKVVSGLRTQGGASKHVGGANRTIIKLAQQLLVHDAVGLAEAPIGELARIDHVYDLVAGNIASEIRGKIADIAKVDHPMAQPVAKAICLLQHVKSVHRTAENIAAALHPTVGADSVLPQVKRALEKLVDAHQVRLSEGQYRIPTPAEDDWATQRAGIKPKPGDIARIHLGVAQALWEPKPAHNLEQCKNFKAGLVFNGRTVFDEDIAFHVELVDEGDEFEAASQKARTRSQAETKSVFWVGAIDDAIRKDTRELFRSKEILARKERGARTSDETALVAEEKHALRGFESELRRRIKEALLAGVVYFRGQDRSPDPNATSVSQAASQVLSKALPKVFDRFKEGAAKVSSKDLEGLMTSTNLRGLPAVFTDLKLIADKKGQPIFVDDKGPLLEVFSRIETKTSYGEAASGKWLIDEFSKEPFGWSLEVVRLFIVSLIRAGKLRATSKGTVIESAMSVEARNTFGNNNLFRSASFQPRVAGTTITEWIKAEEAHKHVFGRSLPEVTSETAVATAIRKSVMEVEGDLFGALQLLQTNALPGQGVLADATDQIRVIRNGTEADAITAFNSSYKSLAEAKTRATQLNSVLTEPALEDLSRAKHCLQTTWPALEAEPGLPEEMAERAAQLADLMGKETFYRELPRIEQNTTAIEKEYRRIFDVAVRARADAYLDAVKQLEARTEWSQLNEEQRVRVAEPLRSRTTTELPPSTGIPFLRSETRACPQLLKNAIQSMLELIEGNRLVTVSASKYFEACVETPEQLDAAVERLKHDVGKLLATDKKVLIQ